eukprot:TRINITY_DN102680_c0_g1_i1.p1 TRINITY_DN102680_c0_g1~~TRINITY_DN102680_c0_g1_i1.p1  ORF type:complete len:712 (+),score=111.11 TRINITY_DN102680_c0_g1_i1:105-2240(+)
MATSYYGLAFRLVACCLAVLAPGHQHHQPSVTSGYVDRDPVTGALIFTFGNIYEAPDTAIAVGVFNDSIASTGTSSLSIRTVGGFFSGANAFTVDDETKFEALGYAEGALTSHRIVQQMHNMASKPEALEVQQFLHEHAKYAREMAAKHGDKDKYWRAVRLLLARERGMAVGLKRGLAQVADDSLAAGLGDSPQMQQPIALAALRSRILSLSEEQLGSQLLRITLVSDIDDIRRGLHQKLINERDEAVAAGADATKLGPTAELIAAAEIAHRRKHTGQSGHCSALVKAVGPRLLVGHATWSSYNEMLRVWKDIRFEHVTDPAIVNKHISFSSYPGYFASTDDWLVLPDTQMAVTETTIDCDDNNLIARHLKFENLDTPMRSMVASLTAATPEAWTSTFAHYNSGTQNNQWMAINFKKWRELAAKMDSKGHFRGRKSEQEGVLVILEQQPGVTATRDKTQHLLDVGFWSSYNVPVFSETLAVSKYIEERSSVCICEAQREVLFEAAQAGVADLDDMKRLLTTNKWESEPLSWSCPKCALASRFDLLGQNRSIGREIPGPQKCDHTGATSMFGAIDAKVMDDRMAELGESLFISGPPQHGVPPFEWSAARMTDGSPMPLHVGHPDGPWAFPWQSFGGRRTVADFTTIAYFFPTQTLAGVDGYAQKCVRLATFFLVAVAGVGAVTAAVVSSSRRYGMSLVGANAGCREPLLPTE